MGKYLWVIGLGLLFLLIAALALSPRWEYQEAVTFEVVSCSDEAGKQKFLDAFEAALLPLGYSRTATRPPANRGSGGDADSFWYAHRSGDREFQVWEIGNDVMANFTTRAEVRLWGLVDGRRNWLRDVETARSALPQLRVAKKDVPAEK